MEKQLVSMTLVAAISLACFSGCASSGGEDTSSQAVGGEGESETTAVALTRTANSNIFPLNGKDIYMEDDSSSWVKIATIWDPELTIYDAESFTEDSVAIAVTFEVSGLDVDATTCYWNYMVADSEGNEIECWTTDYQTDDLEIQEDGVYQMVFDYSKVEENSDVAEIKSLQIAFPDMTADTTTSVTVTDAVCIMEEEEIGTIYNTASVE